MGSILASAIFAKAQAVLQDLANVQWSPSDLIGWLNSGQREIVLLKPNSLTRNESVAMVAGAKQSLPAAGLVLIDVVRNMGANGATPGGAIRSIQRDVLDTVIPGWHAFTAKAEATYYIYDVRDPKTFYVYPPQPTNTTQRLEIIYSVAPVDLTADNQAIAVDDIYEGCLLDYLLYRALDRPDGDPAAALSHQQAFQSALGIKLKGETSIKPPPTVPT